MLKTRHSNAHAAIFVIVIVTVLFIGMYMMMDPFARIYSKFHDAKDATKYPTEQSCISGNGHWMGGACYELPERAHTLIERMRRVWLIAPIIFVISMVWWYISVSTNKDPYYYGKPPGGGFR